MNEVKPHLSFDEYLSLDAISSHGLNAISRSPLHYLAGKAQRAPTPAQLLGTVAHVAILEQRSFFDRFVLRPNDDRRTKAGKAIHTEAEEYAAAKNATIITEEQRNTANAMREAVMNNPYAKKLLAKGQAEVSLLFELDGIQAKARPDWISAHNVVVDLKTAIDASPKGFERAVANFGYHLQAAFYLDACAALGIAVDAFVFLVVEKEPPYACALYQLDEEAIHAGRVKYQHALSIYRSCLKSGQWPGYSQEITTLSLPTWANR